MEREIMAATEERFLGCLLGLATGDAVGTTLEFKSPGTFEPISEMVGGGPFRLKPGEWTDDTSMALCLAASLVETRGFNPKDQMERYVAWHADGYMSSNGYCFDVGGTVSTAMRKYGLTGEPNAGSSDPYSAGNGSIMRLAPVPMFFASDAPRAIKHSAASSRTTHAAVTCLDACRYLGGLIWGALHGIDKADLLSPNFSPTGDHWKDEPLCEGIANIAAGSYKVKQPPQIQGSGFVVHSFEAALWAFHNSNDFRSGCLLAVNLGDDADTTGAVYGQLAGAYYGSEGIPESWRNKLALRDMIEELARGLWKISQSR